MPGSQLKIIGIRVNLTKEKQSLISFGLEGARIAGILLHFNSSAEILFMIERLGLVIIFVVIRPVDFVSGRRTSVLVESRVQDHLRRREGFHCSLKVAVGVSHRQVLVGVRFLEFAYKVILHFRVEVVFILNRRWHEIRTLLQRSLMLLPEHPLMGSIELFELIGRRVCHQQGQIDVGEFVILDSFFVIRFQSRNDGL